MLGAKMESALNGQVNAELYSAYLYMAMSMYFEDEDLAGAASWMRVQAQEEMWHAQKFIAYINDLGGRVILDSIEKPPSDWDSILAVFQAVLEHEQKVSSLINGLVALAREEKDYMTDNFLQWFVAEQVEEEASATDVIRKLRLAGDVGGGLLMVDNELGQRVFTPPAASVE